MPKCRECRWLRVDVGDATKGVCLYGAAEKSGEEVSAGVQQRVIPGKRVDMRAEACEHFEPKVSRQQFLKEGL